MEPMEAPPTAELTPNAKNLRVYPESSSFDDDPDIVEIAPPIGWNSTHQKRKRSQVAPQVIEIDEDDDLDCVMIISESKPNKNKQPVVQSKSWQKQVKDGFSKTIAGSSSYFVTTDGVTNNSLENYEAGSSFLKISNEFDYAKYDYDDYGVGDYDDDDYGSCEEYDFNAEGLESDYSTSLGLAAKFDNLDLPPGIDATVPWLQKPANDQPKKNQEKTVLEDQIDVKYRTFKQFDTVQDNSDHYFSKPENIRSTFVGPEFQRKNISLQKPSKDWAKRIQNDWKILEKDLPETIFVRIYEERMDILRAVIIGPAGTPYHDGLFFFDVFFPPSYPLVPPVVHYHSGGLRLNPNLYECGKVCLSLLNTWSGTGCEKWSSAKSTMLQVLVSIQALVLNAKPYFNEPGFANSANTPHGEKASLAYNENTFLLSCRTMLYSLRRPPKHFEDFVAGHFRKHGHAILAACKAYMGGTQVGCAVGNGVQDIEEGDKSSSHGFKSSLKKLFEDLLMEFTVKGADCDDFLAQKLNEGFARSNTRLSLGR